MNTPCNTRHLRCSEQTEHNLDCHKCAQRMYSRTPQIHTDPPNLWSRSSGPLRAQFQFPGPCKCKKQRLQQTRSTKTKTKRSGRLDETQIFSPPSRRGKKKHRKKIGTPCGSSQGTSLQNRRGRFFGVKFDEISLNFSLVFGNKIEISTRINFW
jgi:hypothetical protein